jgi:hypothetical protein
MFVMQQDLQQSIPKNNNIAEGFCQLAALVQGISLLLPDMSVVYAKF